MAVDEDWLRRFHLEQVGVRGVVTRLDQSWREVAAQMKYPQDLLGWLGECVAASALLAGNIKLSGSVSIHLRTEGSPSLVFAECGADGKIRGLARWTDPLPQPLRLDRLAPGALLAITVDQTERNQRYQGMVPLAGDGLGQAFEHYFAQSEQLPTAIRLVASPRRCAGMLVQQLPTTGGVSGDSDGFERVGMLFRTVRDAELLDLPPEILLRRLFAEDDVRLHPAQPVAFGCRCSRARVESVLLSLGPEEAAAATAPGGSIDVRCEFCNRNYPFDAVDLARLFRGLAVQPGTDTAQ